MASCIKEELSDHHLEDIKSKAIDWALVNGISMRPSSSEEDQDKVVHAPFALFPTPIPSYILKQATQSMTHFSQLMHRVAMDDQFLQEVFKNVIEVDDFSKRLYDIYLQVKNDTVQPICLGLFRNDFMLDYNDESETSYLKQVEFNTLAAGLGGLTSKLPQFYGYILDLAGVEYNKSQIPDNKTVDGFASGLVQAWQLYGNTKGVILFLVSHNERNIMDQRLLEFEIYKQNKEIKVIRKTFDELVRDGRLTQDRRYIIDKEEIGVVYYRVGYSPQHYTSDKIWLCRLQLEQAKCIKCPPINYQLVGAKKIQQVLAKPGILKRFISDENIINLIQSTFTGQYSLDMGEEGDKAIEMAIKSPDRFVLKPQREGGGNNMYGDEIRKVLEGIRNSPKRNAYILMDRIKAKPQLNYLVKTGMAFVKTKCIPELGIFGCYIGSGNQEIYNIQCGYMFRTKLADVNEGGFNAGLGGLDIPFLIEDI